MKLNKTFSVILPLVLILINSQNISAQMYWNQTAQFAGNSGSYISVPNSPTLDINGSFTLEAWINPTSLTGASKGIVSKGGLLGSTLRYGLRILTSGRLELSTNGSPRLRSSILNPIVLNKWTHVSASYNSNSGVFSIYIDGLPDTTVTIGGAAPPANADSLFVGISGASTPFKGQLDEVRIWNRELSAAEVGKYFRTSLGVSSGIYSGLNLSLTFQSESNISPFTMKDLSGNNNSGNDRNITTVSQSYNPYHTIDQNECIELDGDEDYLAGKSNSSISPVTGITLECWVYPRSGNNCSYISKGNAYGLVYENNLVKARINGFTISSFESIPTNQWSRISFTYDAASSKYAFRVNLQAPDKIPVALGNISSNTDSLYIGGVPGAAGDLNGFIDEVRIFNYAKTLTELDKYYYNSIDASNDPSGSTIDVSYNMDGYGLDNSDNGGPELFFRNNARFSHPSTIAGQPVSPLCRSVSEDLTKGYYVQSQGVRIPETGTSGITNSSQLIGMNSGVISDINVYIALNHTNLSNLEITLTSPTNVAVKIFDNKSTKGSDNNLVTVFDDQADSLLSSGTYPSFYARIKPDNNLNSAFSGQNMQGIWRLKINDEAANDTGYLYGWGIQINNQSEKDQEFFCLSTFQGFYNEVSNFMIPDTGYVYLREFTSPYILADSSKAIVSKFDIGIFRFTNSVNEKEYYIQYKHRNSIETWSNFPVKFRNSTGQYGFDNSASAAFGGNVIQVDAAPVRFAFYSGDVNQDGTIDLADGSLIDNDAFNFASGYLPADLNGDGVIDLADAVFADNNAANFVSAITP